MTTLIDGLRTIVGTPSFYDSSGNVDYGAVCEYFACIIIVCIVVSSIFKIVRGFLK